jgi:hypothetical protein
MKKIFFLYAFLGSLTSSAQYLKLCNDSVFVRNVELTKEFSSEDSYSIFYITMYVKKYDIGRLVFLSNLLHKPPVTYTIFFDTTVIEKEFIDDLLGLLIIYDIQSKTNISFKFVTESRYPGVYCTDFIRFDSLIQKSKEEIANRKYLVQRAELFERTEYSYYNIYFNYLIPYFQNSIENRITFIEKYYKYMDLRILEIIKTDLDTTLEIVTPEIRQKKYVKKIVLNNVVVWRQRLKEMQKKYSGN